MIFACSICGARAATFELPVYSGVTGRRFRTDRLEEARAIVETADLRKIDALLKEEHWREIAVYTIGEPRTTLDAYCPECDATYCKAHLVISASAHAGYGEQITATCPRGHERVVYDDYRDTA